LSYGLLRLVEVLIALLMKAASTSEASVNFYQTTRRNNPEDSQQHIHICFYLKCVLNIAPFCTK
jgi:hypothetical protein